MGLAGDRQATELVTLLSVSGVEKMHSAIQNSQARAARRTGLGLSFRWLGLALVLVLLISSVAQAADVVRVQEDWELVLDQVSESKHSPQFETLMSPFPTDENLSDFFCRITWNYSELPDFVPGGFQLQTWFGPCVLSTKDLSSEPFSTVGETVTWTQELEVDAECVYFRVKNGQSATWGAFGGTHLQLWEFPHTPDLNSYSPQVSVKGSGVTYGGNRVVRLRITAVRLYDAEGNLLSNDTTSRTVHER
jgi:hypothetical protein